MNRIIILTTLALMLPFVGAGQTTPRYWEKGPLTWNDFAVVDRSIGAEHSYLEFGLDVILRPQEVEGGTLQVRTAVAATSNSAGRKPSRILPSAVTSV